jgi:hypothetical protein
MLRLVFLIYCVVAIALAPPLVAREWLLLAGALVFRLCFLLTRRFLRPR